MDESTELQSSSPLLTELEELEQQLIQAQAKLQDLKELAKLEQLPPERWTEFQDQIMALEERLQTHLADLNPLPTLFWQVVRFGGLGLVLGFALGQWFGE